MSLPCKFSNNDRRIAKSRIISKRKHVLTSAVLHQRSLDGPTRETLKKTMLSTRYTRNDLRTKPNHMFLMNTGTNLSK